jgi:hypothetical protein
LLLAETLVRWGKPEEALRVLQEASDYAAGRPALLKQIARLANWAKEEAGKAQ